MNETDKVISAFANHVNTTSPFSRISSASVTQCFISDKESISMNGNPVSRILQYLEYIYLFMLKQT